MDFKLEQKIYDMVTEENYKMAYNCYLKEVTVNHWYEGECMRIFNKLTDIGVTCGTPVYDEKHEVWDIPILS